MQCGGSKTVAAFGRHQWLNGVDRRCLECQEAIRTAVSGAPASAEQAVKSTAPMNAEEAEDFSVFSVLKADMEASIADGVTRCDWYKAQSVLHQRILDRRLSALELEEIREGADSRGFVIKARSKKRAKSGYDKGGEDEGGANGAESWTKLTTHGEKGATEPSKARVGVGGGGAFAALADGAMVATPGKTVLVEDRMVTFTKEERKERKKARLRAQREAADEEPQLESSNRDALEQQLARSHSMAAAAAVAVPKKTKLRRFKAREIDEMKRGELRRVLADRGVEKPEWVDKPDELKLLREHAKQLPSVCEEVAGIAKSRKRVAGAAVASEDVKEVDAILAKLDADAPTGVAASSAQTSKAGAEPLSAVSDADDEGARQHKLDLKQKLKEKLKEKR
jgi:hypothetical protein